MKYYYVTTNNITLNSENYLKNKLIYKQENHEQYHQKEASVTNLFE